jgi:hypothetical protein
MGTKVSASQSFQTDLGVKLGFSVPGVNKISAGAQYSVTSSDSHSETISKGQSVEIKATGNEDGVNHDQDEFILLLNPAVAASLNATCGVNWYIGLNSNLGASLEFYRLSVSYLKNPSSMPADVAHQLQLLNFNNDDYQTLLGLDPFANGATSISSRFAPTTYSFPYEPTEQQTDCNAGICSCTSFSETTKNSLQTDSTSSSSKSYQVGASVGSDMPLPSVIPSAAFTWKTDSSKEDTTDSSQSASVTIACPSTTYQGPTEMAIYWDSLFGSFMFKPEEIASGSVLSEGIVTNAAGKPVAHRPVELAFGTKTYHTFTDSHGHFVFISVAKVPHPPTAKLTAEGAKRVVKLASPEKVKIRVH